MPTLDAKPNPLTVDFKKSAIVVVDMQNAFASKGGMLDIARIDITDASRVVRVIRSVIEAARHNAVAVVYLRMAYKPDLSDSDGPNSPNFHKQLAMSLMCSRPELKGKVLTEGTWDAEIVENLAPQPADLVITKTRYSGFAGTPLDSQLRMRGIQYLFFAGIATNVCVESTLRDAYFHDYWPILLRDAAMPAGPPAAHEATLFNVESFFGWTITSEELLSHLREESDPDLGFEKEQSPNSVTPASRRLF
jgi:ureidoacrylate peracid hydrolase